jgi:hypothetical protein
MLEIKGIDPPKLDHPHMENTENIILYNTRIYEEENFTPEEFLVKVSRVKRIRTSKDLMFTFFPLSAREMDRNMKLWEFANGNTNALNYENHKYFILMMPRWLYLFLRYTPQKDVINAITIALTGLYAGDPEQRLKMEEKLDRSLYLNVKENFFKYFSDFEDFTFIVAQDWKLADDINDEYFDKRKKFITRFDYFFRDHCGNPLILPFIFPIYDPRFGQKSAFTKTNYEVRLVNSYFTKSDWRRIVLGESSDELIRIDSEEEPWNNWVKNFQRANRLQRI